jgi:phosphatidylserine/phosphatidylglycerophosphate/cardiolipin synthase-like enzyme
MREQGMRFMKHRNEFSRILLVARALLLLLLLIPGATLAAPGLTVPTQPDWELPDWGSQESGTAAANLFDRIRVDGQSAGLAQVRAITNNVEAWWTRWWLLSQARNSIDITYFIIDDDVFGLSLLGMLAKKAREGVKIRFMLDSRGSKSLSSVLWGQGYLKEISKLPNVDVRIFNPLHKALLRLPKDLRNVVASNHDKILLVDGEWVITGGRNISRDYFASRADYPKAFRDTDILLKGQYVAGRAFRAFNEEYFVLKNAEVETLVPKWNPRSVKLELARQIMDRWIKDGQTYPLERMGSKLRPLARKLHKELQALPKLYGYRSFTSLPSTERYPVHLLDKSSLAHRLRNDITGNLVRMIEVAKHHLIIQNPYIILTKEIHEALKKASDRGVHLIIHTNGPLSTDGAIPQAYFLREWKNLLAEMKNLRIFVSPGPGPLHAKVMLVDDQLSVIGTYNLDTLSQSVNSEIVAVVNSRPFAKARRAEIAADMRHATEWTIRRLSDGTIETVVGPENTVKNFKALLANLLAKWKWFRKFV